MSDIPHFLEESRARFEQELFDFLKYPSISANPAHRQDIEACAQWLYDRFLDLGMQCEILPTAGLPVVLAESVKDPKLPTVLVYGHYDVQPVDPVDLWVSPPFEPRVENGVVYARGATDDKGQVYTHVKAAEAWLRTHGRLPVNLIYLIEGEEEIGSMNLEAFIEKHINRFSQASCVIVSDTSQFAKETPAICYALRGISYLEVIVTGANQDLHSGMYGGIVPNPAVVVGQIIASLKDKDGKILVDGFYENVKEPEAWEEAAFAKLPWDYKEMAASLGIPELPGEKGYSLPVRKWCRPTLDVNGIYGGYSGEGAKTVIPSKAGAKISMRLVPGQDPEKINQRVEAHIRSQIPSACQVEIKWYQSSPAVVVPIEDPAIQAGREAYTRGFGKEPLLIREGASIPIVSFFADRLKLPVVLLGFGLPDDNLHAPNEKFTLADYHRGIATSVWFMEAYARLKKG